MIRYCDGYWEDVDKALGCVPGLDSLSGKSVLITGGTGMILSTVSEMLLRFNRTHTGKVKIILAGRSRERTCRRFDGFAEGKDFYFAEYDATAGEALKFYADYIIHGAGNASPAVYVKEPVETMLANFVGLNGLLSAAAGQGCRRVLYVSSSEVYGNREEMRPYREDDYGFVDILNPRASYPCSKRAAETLCAAYILEHNLDIVTVRPGHIYGPSVTDTDDRASAQFTRCAARGEDIVLKSAGTQLRSYCYTMDCASAVLAVLLNGKCGQAYNISNKNSVVTIADIARGFATASGGRVIYGDASEREMTGYNLMTNSSLNAEKLEALGWRAVFDMESGIERTLKYFAEKL